MHKSAFAHTELANRKFELASQIRQYQRSMDHLSVSDFAELAGCSSNTMYKIINCKESQITLDKLYVALITLGATVNMRILAV